MGEKPGSGILCMNSRKMNDTLFYYENYADDFAAGTAAVNFSAVADRFCRYLPEHALILDFGCGAGRDTKYFLEKGFRAEAIDGSAELCRYASALTGIPVRQMLFEELDETDRYDGIWACASLLHVARTELPDILRRISRALKSGGFLYASFKYGDFEGMRNERFFTDFTEVSIAALLKNFPELIVKEEWISGDVRPGRGEEKWLNMILRKQTIC